MSEVGNWTKIGYKMNVGTVFHYTDGLKDATDGTAAITAKTANAWVATSQSALNDCISGSAWSLDIEANASAGGSVQYTTAITNDSNGDCSALTPSFSKLKTSN